MQTATTDALVGRKLESRYRIVERIARGGMSTVYAAVDERLDRMVAVKVMSSALSADPAFSDRFAREARAAARLTHLNAVSVYDQGQEAGPDGHHVFLVMELVEGRTLRDLIRERSRLTVTETVAIMEPVLGALAAAHRAGLVHRDVKPENILISDEGVVKVADFGLAHAVETDPTSTRTGLMMGTVAYCSPEQIARGEADPRSDVYSAGVVMFELLTGHPPYSGESAMNIAYQHVHGRVPAPSSRIKGAAGGSGEIPAEIDEIVVAATDSDPASRPHDAAALLAELADTRARLGLPVTPVPSRTRPPRTHRRNGHLSDQRALGRAPESATTQSIGATAGNDTVRVEGAHHGSTSRLDGRSTRGGSQGSAEPPPPVVTPPTDERDVRRRRRRRSFVITLLVLALFVGAFFAGKAFIQWRFAHVPKTDGATLTSARRELKEAGYRVRVNEGKPYSNTVAANHVLSTDPSSGSRLSTGSTVTITLSAGKQTWAIPPTSGMSVDDALISLKATGDLSIKQQPSQQYNDDIAKGDVIGTSPAAGVRVASDQPVTLIVSRGPPSVAVPDIPAGTPLSDAKKSLRSKGFQTQTTDQFSDSIARGDVISVSPTGSATKGSTITLVVSRGPEMVDVPNVTGLAVADAQAKVQAANLVPNVRKIPGLGDGKVVLQTPSAGGNKVRAGSTVTLYIFGI